MHFATLSVHRLTLRFNKIFVPLIGISTGQTQQQIPQLRKCSTLVAMLRNIMDIYKPSEKIQISVLEIRHNPQDLVNSRSIRLYYESNEKIETNIILPNEVQIKILLVPKINWYNQKKGIALEESESNLHYLTQVLRIYFSKNEYPKDERNLDQLDFMKKRDILSRFLIKKDSIFHDIPELSSKLLRDDYTSIFNQYILHRNIFAHGILVYSIVKNIFYIEHKDPASKKTAYAILKDNCFSDFVTKGNNVRKVLIEMEKKLK